MPPKAEAPARAKRPSADETRQRILTAALDVFAQRSFDGAATREIATQAGVTQPLLNYHYSSKEELWRASVDDLFGSLNMALTQRFEGLRGVESLATAKLIVREFIYFSAKNPQLHRIITAECKADGDRLDWLIENHVRSIFDQTIAMFDGLVTEGSIAKIPSAHLYYILTGAGATIFVLGPEFRRLTGLDPTSDSVIEEHADAVVELLFGSAAVPEEQAEP